MMKFTCFLVLACALAPLAAVDAQVTIPPAKRIPPGQPAPRPGSPSVKMAPPARTVSMANGVYIDVASGLRSRRTSQEWYQDDPADSLYRAAHALFNKQEYRPAAARYSELRVKYPTSRYFCDAAYYEAFARYRLGTPADLRTGYTALDGAGTRCASAARRNDVPELLARINGALARQGDADAAARVRTAVTQGQNVCDSEERNVKIEALSALAQMDPQSANPVLRGVLNTKDRCSAPVRRQALSLVARRNDPESVALLGQVAKNDADRDLQLEAVRVIGRMSNDAAIATMEEFLRNSLDERVQAEAANAMARSDHPRAQAGVRALIERQDVSEKIRIAAINSLSRRPTIASEYWRSLYAKVESDELRRAVVYALARSDTDDGQQFLLALARNPAEPSVARDAALSRIRSTAPIGELYKIFETADSRSMRMSIVNGLAARNEPEATDRLIDIAKTSTDVEVSRAAIRALGQSPRKDDPKVLKALADIVTCCDL